MARDTLVSGGGGGAKAGPAGSAPSATSQTATAATAATAQATQAAITARRAQDSFIRAATTLQAVRASQAAARAAALAGPGLSTGKNGQTDGLGDGLLNPVGGVPPPSNQTALQLVQLDSGGKNQLALGASGSVTLPNGTPQGDQITVTGAGSVTSAGGTVTTTAGSVTTTTGGTLVTTTGGTISLTAGSGTLTATTATTFTSTLPGTITLPDGGTETFTANQVVPVPANGKVTFTGSGTGTVNVAGAGTVALSGAGTLSLANVAGGASGGTISTTNGTTTFTNGGQVSALPAGSKINLLGSGTINLTGTTDGSAVATLPIIIPASISSAPNFSTTGTLLNTTSYTVPNTATAGSDYAWTGVGALSESKASDGSVTDTITQNSNEALLYWSSFNIGKNTTLDFDQSAGGANAGSWVAINRIVNDPSLAPSKILGNIQASGQVYVIDQNGIIFGGSSQVNTHALVASSLPINRNLISPEFLLGGSSTDNQFLFSQLVINQVTGSVTNPLPTFTPPDAPAGGDGAVVVQPGAILEAPSTGANIGGKIALIGPTVLNQGTIKTPDGQTILAAGLQVGFNPHAQTDPTLRGVDVFVGSVNDSAGQMYGQVTNDTNALIESPRADVTLAGSDIEQNGVIDSLTSVSLNGRIDLLADYNIGVTVTGTDRQTGFTNIQTGTVNFGSSSLTQILPDTSSASAVGTSLALSSIVNVEALDINMLGGAELIAPGAQATAPTYNQATPRVELTFGQVDLTGALLTAGVNFDAGTWNLNGTPSLSPTGGTVTIHSDAVIDVSGSRNVQASVADDIVAVQLRGTELANSPLQQNGPLRGQTVDIDIRQAGVYNGVAWIGSPIGDLSGYAGLVQHTAGELTVNGGTVNLQAGTSVTVAPDATINVSGGSINYQAANISTTKVVAANGQVLDISQATPDQIYEGLNSPFTITSQKWGVSQSFSNSLGGASTYDPGYIQGGNVGGVTISSPTIKLDGNLYGNSVVGTNQVLPTKPVSQLNATFSNPSGNSQELGLSQFSNASFQGADFLPILTAIKGVPTSGTLVLNLIPTSSGTTPQNVVFQPGSALPNPESRDLNLSANLVNSDGFGNLTIDGNLPSSAANTAVAEGGNIVVPQGVDLTLASGGSLTWAASNIDIESSISAPGGSLNFTAQNVVASLAANATLPLPLEATDGRGNFTLGSDALLSTAGLIVDNSAGAPGANTLQQFTDGGSVIIKGYNATLVRGTNIDASGGVLVASNGRLAYGAGGEIDIEAGQDPFIQGAPNYAILGGHLMLGSTLSAYSGKSGGSLSILAPTIQVGGDRLENMDSSNGIVQENSLVSGNGTTLWLDRRGTPDFFSQGGFGSFSLIGLGLAPITYANSQATAVDPFASTPGIVLASDANSILNLSPVAQSYRATNTNGVVGLDPTTFSLASQRSPVSLSFNASGVTGGPVGGSFAVRGDLVMDQSATIQTDPLARVALSGQTVTILGQIFAPGGTIAVSGGSNSDSVQLFATPGAVATVDLGPSSVLSTKGTVETTYNALGYTTGTVLDGGTITVTGNIVGEAGSKLDVSGTTGTLDVTPAAAGLSPSSFNSQQLVPLTQSSNAGAILLGAAVNSRATRAPTGELLAIDSTLIGGAQSGAEGGSLTIAPTPPENSLNPLDTSLVVTQGGLIRTSKESGQAVIGQAVAFSSPINDVDGNPISAYFSANSNLFTGDSSKGDANIANNGGTVGGFSSLTLNGTVQFTGRVSIATGKSLIVANNPAFSRSSNSTTGGVIYADSPVNLSSAYVRLGLPFSGPGSSPLFLNPVESSPTLSLNVRATKLLDVGNLTVENIGQLNLQSGGDIRGDGTLNVAGTVSLDAAQVYPVTESTFTIAAYDSSDGTSRVNVLSSLSTLPSLPLSGGGLLQIYANTIDQAGVLRAPLGSIDLGSLTPPPGSGLPATQSVTLEPGSTTSVSAVDPNTNVALTIPYGYVDNGGNWNDPAGNIITGASSPTLPAKSINLSANSIGIAADAETEGFDSTLDLTGGGNLIASQFVSGTGGTNDILGSTNSFAILPSANQRPYSPYDTVPGYATSAYANLQIGDQIYLSAVDGLSAGVYTLLPARYALLPGAFLVTPKSGAPLVASATQPDGASIASGYRLNGLDSTREQTTNTLFEIASQSVIYARAQYLTSDAETFFPKSAAALSHATPRLPGDAGQLVLNATQALTLSSQSRTLASQAAFGGLGSIVDIATTADIDIGTPDATDPASISALLLDPASLSAFNAGSLLVGGYRNAAGTTATVTTGSVRVDNASGAVLSANDLILVSNGAIRISDGSTIVATSGLGQTQSLAIINGSSASPSSDGTLLRVSNSATDTVTRPDAINLADLAPSLNIGSNVKIAGNSLSLDSTGFTDKIDPTANLTATGTASISSGQISLNLDNSTAATGLVLSGPVLANLQNSAQALSLLSYSSIDIYGGGLIGAGAVDGQYQVQSLALQAGEIRGFDNGQVTINAKNVLLGNSGDGTGPGPAQTPLPGSTLAINADTIAIGVNALAIDQYAQVGFTASSAIVLSNGTGSLSTASDLTLSTSLLTAAPVIPLTPNQEVTGTAKPNAATRQTISAAGTLQIVGTGGATPALKEGLGASLTLAGTSVEEDSKIQLPSGTLSLVAATGDVSVSGTIDVSGTTRQIYSATEDTSGGQVTLNSYNGGVILNSGSIVDVSAPSGGGNAGFVTITAPKGTFNFAGSSILGQGGNGGQGGSFSLDVGSLASPSLSPLEQALNPVVTGAIAGDVYLGGFTQNQTIRVRTGDVNLDGKTATDNFNLSADGLSANGGSITISGEIAGNSGQADANDISTPIIDISTAANSNGTTVLSHPGVNGGAISLEASGNVTLASTALVSVAGQTVDDAGKGGAIALEAGAETAGSAGTGSVDIQRGSVIDLSIANTKKAFAGSEISGTTGTLHLRAPQTADGSNVQINPINGNVVVDPFSGANDNSVVNPTSVVVEGYKIYTASDGSIDGVNQGNKQNVAFDGSVYGDATGFVASSPGIMSNLLAGTPNAGRASLFEVIPGAEIINPNLDTATNPTAGDLTLASSWDLSTFRFGPNDVAGDLTLRAGGNVILNFGASLSDGFTANPNPTLANYGLWSDVLMSPGSQSWSYRIVSGADFGAADYHQVLPALRTSALIESSPSALIAGSGSVIIGANTPVNRRTTLTTAQIMGSRSSGGLGYFQTIRTGTGAIDIASGGDVQLLNNVATIYTAGTQVPLTTETGTVSLESNPNDTGTGNTVLLAPTTLPAGFGVGSSFLGSTVASINGSVITLNGNADTTVSTITPVAFSGTGGAGVVEVASSSGSSVTLATQPPGLVVGASLLGSTIVSINGPTVTLAGPVDAPSTFTDETFSYSIPQVGFDVPVLNNPRVASNSNYNFGTTATEAQYSQNGGNITITAQGNIAHDLAAAGILTDDSSKELPTNWLLRRGYEMGGVFANNGGRTPEVASTTWWVDFNNFFEGVGTLGGGNLTLTAGQSIDNVDAVVPTNATLAGKDASGNLIAAGAGNLVENGGGDLVIHAGININGGVYYVERGQGTLSAGDRIMTNPTRFVPTLSYTSPEASRYLPTTLYLGKGSYNLSSGNDLLLGPVVNPFLLPQGINNTVYDRSYFSTYALGDSVTATSLAGQVTIKDDFQAGSNLDSLLIDFYTDQVSVGTNPTNFTRGAPWLGLIESTASVGSFSTQAGLLPATVNVVSLSGDINLQGNLTLSPSPTGNLNLVAEGSVNAFQPLLLNDAGVAEWVSSRVNLSDADPSRINGIATPLGTSQFDSFNGLFNVSGSTTGNNVLLSTEQQLHADLPVNSSDRNSVLGPLHANDTTPVVIYAATGNIDGLSLFSGKSVNAVGGNDILDIALYVQNTRASDISLVQSGRDIIAYDQNSTLRQEAHNSGGIYYGETPDNLIPNGSAAGAPNTGDIQIAGPGTLEVLAGRNLTLGGLEDNLNSIPGTGYGVVSVGNTLNPALPFNGANVIAAAGLGRSTAGLSNEGLAPYGLDDSHGSALNYVAFENLFLNPGSAGAEADRYLPLIGDQLGLTNASKDQIWAAFEELPVENRDVLATTIFYDVLRDAGRDHNDPSSPNFGTYAQGYVALGALFPPDHTYQGDISLTAREIKTDNVGSINLLAPGGGIDVGINNNGSQAVDQGILTVSGGPISIFTDQNVAVGTSRIFTLHGGDEIIWSSHGNIAAGASSKTVQSAPPTRVLIDPTSGNVETDLAGLATGGGIGVLETVVGAPPGSVDLIAPVGTVDAGDAGIRASGNINIAAAQVLNAGNIQAGGSSSGVPTASTPNIGAAVAASSAAGSTQSAEVQAARPQNANTAQPPDLPFVISVEVTGYGSGDTDSASTTPPSENKSYSSTNAG